MSSRSWWVMLAFDRSAGWRVLHQCRPLLRRKQATRGHAAGLADACFRSMAWVAPTFSAYEIAASFLLPFVAIRAIAGDVRAAALKLELQQGMIASFNGRHQQWCLEPGGFSPEFHCRAGILWESEPRSARRSRSLH